MAKIAGRFRVESDRDGSFYRIRFTPDVEQIGSPQPKGVVVLIDRQNIKDDDIEAIVEAIVGPHREHNFRDARLTGSAEFTGEMNHDDYARFAKF
jgi:hypothetical protein